MTPNDIKEIIEKIIPQAEVYVMDPRNDGQHLQAIVISPIFEGKTLIEQHKMVIGPLKNVFKESVHALGLKTFTPSEGRVALSNGVYF